MIHRISQDIEQAVEENLGLAEVQGERTDYVVMTKAMYRECLGLDDQKEAQETLAAINRGIADMEAGRTKPAVEFFEELEQLDDLSG